MKILIVASINNGRFSPFVTEQAEALNTAGCEIEYFGVTGKGVRGYIKCLPALKAVIRHYHPDIIHAHYGLCGLLANLQRRVPVITTYHGSDINQKSVLPFSRMAMLLSAYNIFVSKKTLDIAGQKNKYTLLPCGINLSDLQLTDKNEARRRMGLDLDKKYVLFASAFDIAVKNYPLAKAAMELVPEAELIELKGYSRGQVTLLMCAADCFLMTSHTEGSPQVIKEAMACGCPIVSVDVGDVKEVAEGVEGCNIVSRSSQDISERIRDVLIADKRTDGRFRIEELGLSNAIVASKLLEIYKKVV